MTIRWTFGPHSWHNLTQFIHHTVHLLTVVSVVLVFVVAFAPLCRWLLREERRRKKGGGPMRVYLSPTGYPLGRLATGGL